jgi:DNA replication and repair protein RecF
LLINKLQVVNLRNLEQVELPAHPSVNTLYGANGAGKTSILEAIALLSRGRSFRSNKVAQVIGPGSSSLSVFAEIQPDQSTSRKGVEAEICRLGLERSVNSWKARKNGEDLQQLSELAESLAVIVMEPNSHALVGGSPDVRRRYLDWGVFHVEPAYLVAWRRYARALKQRNAALRAGQRAILASLESILATEGEKMSNLREQYAKDVSSYLSTLMPALSPGGLGQVSIEYRRGWSSGSLAEALREQRDRDLERGSTQAGPHRGDLVIRVEGDVIRDSVSRGEQKIIATALIMAQARRQCDTGRIPVLLLDDLASEFDRRHFDAALDVGRNLGVQMWITGVDEIDPGSPHSRFHVEHGAVRKMV